MEFNNKTIKTFIADYCMRIMNKHLQKCKHEHKTIQVFYYQWMGTHCKIPVGSKM